MATAVSSKISVLRLGHRLVRDDRVTTHVCLVARAFGAERIFLVDAEEAIKRRVDDVSLRWGGGFEVLLIDDWRNVVKDWRDRGGVVVHLTMYGVNVDDLIDIIRSMGKEVLVVVGAEKAPSELFENSDYNVAVGNQPHSEVAALAVFLDRFFRGEELKRDFSNYKVRVLPSAKDKRVEVVN